MNENKLNPYELDIEEWKEQFINDPLERLEMREVPAAETGALAKLTTKPKEEEKEPELSQLERRQAVLAIRKEQLEEQIANKQPDKYLANVESKYQQAQDRYTAALKPFEKIDIQKARQEIAQTPTGLGPPPVYQEHLKKQVQELDVAVQKARDAEFKVLRQKKNMGILTDEEKRSFVAMQGVPMLGVVAAPTTTPLYLGKTRFKVAEVPEAIDIRSEAGKERARRTEYRIAAVQSRAVLYKNVLRELLDIDLDMLNADQYEALRKRIDDDPHAMKRYLTDPSAAAHIGVGIGEFAREMLPSRVARILKGMAISEAGGRDPAEKILVEQHKIAAGVGRTGGSLYSLMMVSTFPIGKTMPYTWKATVPIKGAKGVTQLISGPGEAMLSLPQAAGVATRQALGAEALETWWAGALTPAKVAVASRIIPGAASGATMFGLSGLLGAAARQAEETHPSVQKVIHETAMETVSGAIFGGTMSIPKTIVRIPAAGLSRAAFQTGRTLAETGKLTKDDLANIALDAGAISLLALFGAGRLDKEWDAMIRGTKQLNYLRSTIPPRGVAMGEGVTITTPSGGTVSGELVPVFGQFKQSVTPAAMIQIAKMIPSEFAVATNPQQIAFIKTVGDLVGQGKPLEQALKDAGKPWAKSQGLELRPQQPAYVIDWITTAPRDQVKQYLERSEELIKETGNVQASRKQAYDEITQPTKAAKLKPTVSYNRVLKQIQNELGLQGNDAAFLELHNRYGPAWENFHKQGINAANLARLVKASEAIAAKKANLEAIEKVEGKPKPGEPKIRDPRWLNPTGKSWKSPLGGRPDMETCDKVRRPDLWAMVDLDRVGRLNAIIGHDAVDDKLYKPVLKKLHQLFGANAFAPMGDEFFIAKPKDMSTGEYLTRLSEFTEFVQGLDIEGETVAATAVVANDWATTQDHIRTVKPKGKEEGGRGLLHFVPGTKPPLDAPENLTIIIQQGEPHGFEEFRRGRIREAASARGEEVYGRPEGGVRGEAEEGVAAPGRRGVAEVHPGAAAEGRGLLREPAPATPEFPGLAKLPVLREKFTQASVDKTVDKFRQIGRVDLLTAIDDIAAARAEALNLTPSKTHKVRDMVVLEVGRNILRKRKGAYVVRFTDAKVKAITQAVTQRDVEWMRGKTITDRTKRSELKLEHLRQRAPTMAFVIEEGGLPPFHDKTGHLLEVEEYLGVPRQARAKKWRSMKWDNVFKNGKIVVPKKYQFSPSETTKQTADEIAVAAHNAGLIAEPTTRSLVAALQTEDQALRAEPEPKAEEERYYEAAREEYEGERQKDMKQLYKLLAEGKTDEAVKFLQESNLAYEIEELAAKKTAEALPVEDVSEAPRQAYLLPAGGKPRVPPKPEELRIAGKGTEKEAARLKDQEIAGQLKLREGAQKSLFVGKKPLLKPKEKKFDAITWVHKVQEYIAQGMSSKRAAMLAMIDARNAYAMKRLNELARPSNKAAQRRMKVAIEKLGVPSDKGPEFRKRYGTLLRGAAQRHKDVDAIVKELQLFGADTEMKAVPKPVETRPTHIDILDARTANQLQGEVERDAQISASTELGKLFDEVAQLAVESHQPIIVEEGPIAIEEPWKLTREKWVRESQQPRTRTTWHEQELYWKRLHQDLVAKALAKGKPVPPEVLAEYPDLAAKAPPTEAVAEPVEKPPITPKEKIIVLDRRSMATAEVIQAKLEEMIATGQIPDEVLKDRVTLDTRIEYFHKSKKPWSIVVVNIGRLGDINDAVGYMQGDAYIKAVADALKDNLPRGSRLGRYSPRGGEFTVVIPRNETITHAALIQAMNAVRQKVQAPDGKPTELSIGIAQNGGETSTETIAEASCYANASRKLGRELIVTHDIYERYRSKLNPPQVVYKPEAVAKTLNVEAKLQVDGYVDVPSLKIRGPADIAEIGKRLTDPSQEKLLVLSVSDEGIIEGVSLAMIGDLERMPFSKFQRLPTFAPHLLMDSDGFYVIHNHPSGDPRPTKADLKQYEFLRKSAAHLGMRFLGGVSIGRTQFAFVKPDGLSLDISIEDIPPAEARFRSPIVSVHLEPGKEQPVSAAEMPGFIAQHLQDMKIEAKSVYAIPLATDGTPCGIFRVAGDYADPHHLAAEIARISAVTGSPRVVLVSGDDPGKWKANLGIVWHELSSMYGVELLDAVSADGKVFRDFSDAIPEKILLAQAMQDAPHFKQPVREYQDVPNSKAKAVANYILHFVCNPEDILQRPWTKFVDRHDLVTKARIIFQNGVAKLPFGKAVLRTLSTSAGRPGEFIEARRELFREINRWHEIGHECSRILTKGWKPAEKNLIYQAIRGEVELNREDNPKMFDAVAEARNLLIEAGNLAVEVGERTGVQLLNQETFVKNFGLYLPRLYMFYEKKGWTPEEWRIATARQWLMEHGVKVHEEGEQLVRERGLSKEEADEIIGSILAREPVGFYVMGKHKPESMKLDLARFRERKNIPGPIRILLGEIKGAGVGYLAEKGIAGVTHDALLVDFFNRIAQDRRVAIPAKEWTMLNPKEQRKFAQIPKGGKLGTGKAERVPRKAVLEVEQFDRMGQIAGMYVLKPVYDDIMGFIEWYDKTTKWVKRGIGLWKALRVAWNPPTFSRNIITNFIFNEMFGDLPLLRLDVYGKCLGRMINHAGIRKKGGAGNPWVIRAKEDGIFETTYARAEITPFMAVDNLSPEVVTELKDIKGAKSLKDFKNRVQRSLVKLAQAPLKFGELGGTLYGAVESFFKFVDYCYQQETFGKPHKEAASIAIKALFNYTEVTNFIRRVRSKWWGAPFVTFQTKWPPNFARACIRKPLTVAKWLALPGIITAISLKILKITREEYKKMRAEMPSWMQDNYFYILLPWRDKYGRVQWLDTTYLFPWGEVADAGIAWVPSMFVGGSPLHSAVDISQKFFVAAETGRPPVDDYFGKEIWRETDLPEVQWRKGMEYINRSFGPTFLPGGSAYEKIARSITGKPDYWGRTWAPGQAVAYEFGMKVVPVDIEEATRNNLYDRLDEINIREAKLSKLRSDFYRETARHIPVLSDFEKQALRGRAAKLFKDHQHQAEELDKLLVEVAEQYDYDPRLTYEDRKRLRERLRTKSLLQLKSYAVKQRMREQITELEQILKERYPESILRTRVEMREIGIE